MHHPHLLTFIAADYCLAHGILKHYLITEYHERGSLMDYLRNTVLDVGAVVVLSQSAASGLAHLHLEIKRLAVEKPSIVHRNITSKSFFVKNDGKSSEFFWGREFVVMTHRTRESIFNFCKTTILSHRNFYLNIKLTKNY